MYIYVASPYSDPDPDVQADRYLEAVRYTAQLIKDCMWAFSPIAHCHDIAVRHELPGHAEYWRQYNGAMLAPAKELHVLQLDGWQSSLGVKWEMEFAQILQKPIRYARWDRGLKIYRIVP